MFLPLKLLYLLYILTFTQLLSPLVESISLEMVVGSRGPYISKVPFPFQGLKYSWKVHDGPKRCLLIWMALRQCLHGGVVDYWHLHNWELSVFTSSGMYSSDPLLGKCSALVRQKWQAMLFWGAHPLVTTDWIRGKNWSKLSQLDSLSGIQRKRHRNQSGIMGYWSCKIMKSWGRFC